MSIDFLLNGGVFASFFASGQMYILPPTEAFVRIPGGYGSVLLLILVLAWIIYGGKETRMIEGMRTGFVYGVLTSLSLTLGLWSITTLPTTFLLIWFVDQMLEMSIAGAVIASVRSNRSRRSTLLVIIGAVVCLIFGVVLQNILR